MVIAFGVIAIVFGSIGPFVAGWIAVGIAVVFGGLAIFFQIRRNSKLEEGAKRKKAGLICGIIGIALSGFGQIATINYADKLKAAADSLGEEAKEVSLAADGFKTMGMIGFLTKALDYRPEGMSNDDYLKQLTDEFEKVGKSMKN